jgi:peptidoglycan/LPS O-acetylase OafA/YrhL
MAVVTIPQPVPEGEPCAPSRPRRPAGGFKGRVVSDHLNMIRGLAALMVLWSHGRAQFIENFKDGSHYDLYAVLLYVSSRFGHCSVMIFFVLSGLLIGSSVIEDVGSGRWSWKEYLTRRLTRLYIVLVPALVLTLVLDRAWVALIEGLPPPPGAATIDSRYVAERTSPVTFLGNLLFLQCILVDTLGGNFSLWSLTNEFWYYLIFPCLWLAARGPGSVARRAAHGAAGVAMLAFVGKEIAAYFVIWLIGALLHVVPRCPWLLRRQRWVRAASAVATLPLLALVVLIGLRRLRDHAESTDLLLGLAFGFFLLVMTHDLAVGRDGWYARLAGTVAGFSFTLYVLHLPILLVFRSCLTYKALWYPDPPARPLPALRPGRGHSDRLRGLDRHRSED